MATTKYYTAVIRDFDKMHRFWSPMVFTTKARVLEYAKSQGYNATDDFTWCAAFSHNTLNRSLYVDCVFLNDVNPAQHGVA